MTLSGDRIELRGILALGVHGVLEEERSRAQPFELDLDLYVDTTEASRTDDLVNTVDYATAAEGAISIVATRSYRLLETLASSVADELLGHPQVQAVTVAVRKLRPPVAVHMATAGVRLTRERS